MENNTLGIKVNVDSESMEKATKNFNKLIESLSKKSKIKLKVNSSSAENKLEKMAEVVEDMKFEKKLVIDTSQAIDQIDEINKKINKDLEDAEPDTSFADKIGMGLSALDSALAAIDATLDESLSTGQKYSAVFGGIGDSLMMIPNAYTLAAGGIIKGVGSIIGYLDKWEAKQNEVFTKARDNIGSLSDGMSTLEGFGDEYDILRSKLTSYSDISKLSKDEQEKLYGMMENIAEIHPELVIGYSDQGRIMTNLNKSSKDLYDMQSKMLELEMERAKYQATKDLETTEDQIKEATKELEKVKAERDDLIKIKNEGIPMNTSPSSYYGGGISASYYNIDDNLKKDTMKITELKDSIKRLKEQEENLTHFVNGTTEALNISNTALQDRANGLDRATLESEDFYKKLRSSNAWLIEELSKDYGVDLEKYKNLAKAKEAIEKKLLGELSSSWSKYAGMSDEELKEKADFHSIAEAQAFTEKRKEIQEILKTDIDDEIKGINLDGPSPTSTTQKIAKIEIDLLADLNRQIDENTNKRNKLKQVLDKTPENDESRVAYLQQENELLKEKQGLLHELANEHRGTIESSRIVLQDEGVEFIGDNVDFESYKSVIDSLNNQLITAKGDKQTDIQDTINNIKDAFKNLVDAQTSEIPKLQQDWRDLYASIKENEIQMNNMELSRFDDQLKEIENQMNLLGEADTLEEVNKRSTLFTNQQEILRSKLIAVNQQIAEYSQMLKDANESTESGAIDVAMLKTEIERLDGLKSDVEISISQNYENERNRMLGVVKEIEDTIIDIVKKGIEEEKDAEDERHEDVIDNLNKEKEKWEEIYDAKLQALQDEQDEIEHAETMEELLDEKAEKQDEINKLILDDSLEAKSKRNTLLEELSEIEKRIADETRDYEYKQREDAINQEKEQKLAYIEEEIEAENIKHENYIEDLDEKLEADYLYAEAHKILMNETYGEIALKIDEYQKQWGEGFSIIADEINSGMVSELEKALELMKQLNYNDELDIKSNETKTISSISKPGELAMMSDEDFENYVKNKIAWEIGDSDAKEAAAKLNEAIRNEYESITYDNYSLADIIGANNVSELVGGSNTISIGNLVEVQGNVDSDTMEDLQDAIDEALNSLKNTLNINGIFRSIS